MGVYTLSGKWRYGRMLTVTRGAFVKFQHAEGKTAREIEGLSQASSLIDLL